MSKDNMSIIMIELQRDKGHVNRSWKQRQKDKTRPRTKKEERSEDDG